MKLEWKESTLHGEPVWYCQTPPFCHLEIRYYPEDHDDAATYSCELLDEQFPTLEQAQKRYAEITAEQVARIMPDYVQELHETPPVGEDVREGVKKILSDYARVTDFVSQESSRMLNEATDRILALVQGKAKGLEWEWSETEWRAMSAMGRAYFISPLENKRFGAVLDGQLSEHPTLEAAKAAAEAHWQAAYAEAGEG